MFLKIGKHLNGIVSLLFGTGTFNQIYMFSVSNWRKKKCGEVGKEL